MQCPGLEVATPGEHNDGFLYGAGDAKVGLIVGKGAEEGARLKAKFLAAVPALAGLIKDLDAAFERNGSVRGLDGRRLFIGATMDKNKLPKRVWKRSLHKALNTLLQSAGAIVMKKALVILDGDIQAKGLVPGKDYEFVINCHDEWQIECLEKHAEFIAETAKRAITKAGEAFKMRCPLAGEAKIGNSWAETH